MKEQVPYDVNFHHRAPGTKVRISVRGVAYEGEVISANNYADYPRETSEPNWYIEWKNPITGQFGYWKQGLDGGTCEFLNSE